MTDSTAHAAVLAALPSLRSNRADLSPPRSIHEVRGLLLDIERAVSADPVSAFSKDVDDGTMLHAIDRWYRAGRFSTPSIGELEARLAARRRGSEAGRIRLSVLTGAHVLTDIGALQATAAPDTLFQVASQFNCLESPRLHITPIVEYPTDHTQGPRAAVSAFPGTFLRHYAAPSADGGTFVQSARREINLLEDVLAPAIATVTFGYLRAQAVADAGALRASLEARFDRIRVGVQDDIEVVLGANWGGHVQPGAPTIAQVLTSTMALGAYSFGDTRRFDECCGWLLKGGYLGTLLAALDLRKAVAVLTLIGGGAFSNPIRAIWDAIEWAVERASRFAPTDLHVVVNARTLPNEITRGELLDLTRRRGGAFVECSGDGRVIHG